MYTFELDLQTMRIGNSGNKHIFWIRLQQLANMDYIEKELEQWVEEQHKQKQGKIYDMSVANAMANANVEMTINKNKSMS